MTPDRPESLRLIGNGSAHSYSLPVMAESAHGSWITDMSGPRHLDTSSAILEDLS